MANVQGGFVMNRDEILEKSRKENRAGDEREIQLFANSSKIGMAVGGILQAIIGIAFALACFVGMIILGLKQ